MESAARRPFRPAAAGLTTVKESPLRAGDSVADQVQHDLAALAAQAVLVEINMPCRVPSASIDPLVASPMAFAKRFDPQRIEPMLRKGRSKASGRALKS